MPPLKINIPKSRNVGPEETFGPTLLERELEEQAIIEDDPVTEIDRQVARTKAWEDEAVADEALQGSEIQKVGPAKGDYNYSGLYKEGDGFDKPALPNRYIEPKKVGVAGYDIATGERFTNRWQDHSGHIQGGVAKFREASQDLELNEPTPDALLGLSQIAYGVLSEGATYEEFTQELPPNVSDRVRRVAWQAAEATLMRLDIESGEAMPAEELPDPPDPPDMPTDEEELVEHPGWMEAAQTTYEYFEGEPFEGSPEELHEWALTRMSGLNNNTMYLGYYSARAAMADDEQAKALYNLMVMYENTDMTWRQFGYGSAAMLLDPTTYAGFGAGAIGAKVAGAASRTAVKQILKRALGAGLGAAPAGALMAGGMDVGKQSVAVSAGAQEGVDPLQTAGAAAIGAGAGLALGGAIGGATADPVVKWGAAGLRKMKAPLMELMRDTSGHLVIPQALADAVAKVVADVPDLGPLFRRLTPEERKLITKRNADAAVRVFRQLDPEEMASVAYAGRAKRGWYQESARAIFHVFGAEDAPRFVGVLAALSPQTSVESNLGNAMRFWRLWVLGGRKTDRETITRLMGEAVEKSPLDKQPRDELAKKIRRANEEYGTELKGTGSKAKLITELESLTTDQLNRLSILPVWVDNAVRSIQAKDPTAIKLSGPKVESFRANLNGDLGEVTNDAWMANYGDVSQGVFAGRKGAKGSGVEDIGGKSPGYLGFSAAVREAADILSERTGETWHPAEIQETIWSYAKALLELREKEGILGKSTQALLDEGRLTPDLLNATPDFASLMSDPNYASLLESAGYGGKLGSLSSRRGGAPADPAGTAGVGAGSEPRHLAATARRIDQLYWRRTRSERLRPSRPSRRDAGGPASRGYRHDPGGAGRLHDLENGARGTRLSPSPELAAAAKATHLAAPDLYNLDKSFESSQAFSRSIAEAKEASAAAGVGGMVDDHGAEAYSKMKLFMTADGKAGFAIRRNGEITSVFRRPGTAHRGSTQAMMLAAVDHGGKWLDAFDTILPQLYSQAGFRPVARLKFDPDQLPPDWNAEKMAHWNNGEPDVVFMVYDPSFKEPVNRNTGGKMAKDWGGAMELTKAAVKKHGIKGRSMSRPKPAVPGAGTRLTPTERSYLDIIFGSKADLEELHEVVPSARLTDEGLVVAPKEVEAMAGWLDETVARRDVGERLPPGFADDSLLRRIMKTAEAG